ncbi:hypothetical protein O3M35_006340 [Rhynocoris fuscipes]|uniref:DNA-directed DNA polymerase family A palm domain-containing protein n=1 Tax=Rhynocoris fuscipes TaxID=488301 RepID=A0AAW1DEI1_9HEMI
MIGICNLLKDQSEVMEKMYSLLISNSLWDLFINIETKLIPIIAVMESWDIKIDKEKIVGIGKAINEKIKSLEYYAMDLAGKKFQIRSSNDLRQILYEELKLDKVLKIEIKGTASTGVKSTAEPILKRLANIHPFPKAILDYRHLHKFKSTYVDGLLNYMRDNKFISTTWEQFSAATGRITSSSPNLQAFPKQPLEGFNIRSTFISRTDHSFLSVDFQHIELRVFAHLASENKLIEAFHFDQDVFTTITKFRLKSEIFDPEERTKTKTLVYAHIYGAGVKKIADILSIDETKASELITQFDELFPGLNKFRQKLLIQCRKDKKLITIGGRQRRFPNINSPDLRAKTYSERQAVNFVIQGSAADICKIAMLCTEQQLRQDKRNSKLLLQIHDELMWEVEDEDLSEVKATVKNILESDCWPESVKLKVPLKVKVTTGKNWGEMS